jgi:hypothetical protein
MRKKGGYYEELSEKVPGILFVPLPDSFYVQYRSNSCGHGQRTSGTARESGDYADGLEKHHLW